jgi:hypothetical protein
LPNDGIAAVAVTLYRFVRVYYSCAAFQNLCVDGPLDPRIVIAMADPDYPMDYVSPPGQAYTYPDIDETVQYPWRENDALATQGNADPVIDPRLYKDLFSQDAPGNPVHEAGDLSEDSQDSPRQRQEYADGMDDDESDYEFSQEGSGRYAVLHYFLSSPFLD